MKSLILLVSIILGLSVRAADNGSDNEILQENNLKVGSKHYLIKVTRNASRPKSGGRGYCGAGKETYLKVFKMGKKKPVFIKLIDSCLKNLDLNGKDFVVGSPQFIHEAIKIKDSSIEIYWLSSKDRNHFKGILDFKGSSPKYSEEDNSEL